MRALGMQQQRTVGELSIYLSEKSGTGQRWVQESVDLKSNTDGAYRLDLSF